MVVTMKPSQPLDGVRDERGEQVGKRIHVGVNHVGAFGLQLLKFKKKMSKTRQNGKKKRLKIPQQCALGQIRWRRSKRYNHHH